MINLICIVFRAISKRKTQIYPTERSVEEAVRILKICTSKNNRSGRKEQTTHVKENIEAKTVNLNPVT